MKNDELNEALMRAIELRYVGSVKELLNAGANANYVRAEPSEESSLQPTTPLRLVVFCISDALLQDIDIKQFEQIAKLLLEHGADPLPAMQLAELRYGVYDATLQSPFMDVWHLIARAAGKK